MSETPKRSLAERHKAKFLDAAISEGREPEAVIEDVAAPVVLKVVDDAAPPQRRLSPVEAHRARVFAAAAIAAGATGTAPARPETGPEATEYDLLRAQLGEHMHQLSAEKSVERKIAAKRQMIDAYDAHVLGVLEAAKETGKAVQDEIFATIMVWRLDIGDYGMALEMAEHVLKHKLSLPERYTRSAATLIAEEIATAGLLAVTLKQDFQIPVLQRTFDLTDAPENNVNDIVRAKLQKALGLHFLRLADSIEEAADGPAGAKRAAYAQALHHLDRAFQLNKKSGTQKERERLMKLLEKMPIASPETSEA
ncbi:hypothetical protein MMA231_02473 [Asticcacaulis sp. MM231]|uniref:phage terminase small subunit n=1 Tax=Asticcacaulis sp. MM231 TaxID=3157666 RepID=UPI0032D579BB